MSKGRLEAFTDAVIAIIMTIMVLELRPPEGHEWSDLRPLIPVFLTFALSFVYLGIYWINHHHLLQLTHHVTGAVLWANLNLLFWLALFPFATAWVGDTKFDTVPTIAYGLVLLLAGIAMFLLQTVILRAEGKDSELATVLGRDLKAKISPVIYLAGIVAAFWNTWVAMILYGLVALMFVIPDRRVERHFAAKLHET